MVVAMEIGNEVVNLVLFESLLRNIHIILFLSCALTKFHDYNKVLRLITILFYWSLSLFGYTIPIPLKHKIPMIEIFLTLTSMDMTMIYVQCHNNKFSNKRIER